MSKLFSEAAVNRFMRHNWPGNVRELRNVVEATLATGERVTLDPMKGDDELPLVPIHLDLAYKESRAQVLEAFEAQYLASLLKRAEGNVSKAARVACMTRSHLFDLLRKHGLR